MSADHVFRLPDVTAELARVAAGAPGDLLALLDEANAIADALSRSTPSGRSDLPDSLNRVYLPINVPDLEAFEERLLRAQHSKAQAARIGSAKRRLHETADRVVVEGRGYPIAEFGDRFATGLERITWWGDLDDYAAAAAEFNRMSPWVADEALRDEVTDILYLELRGDLFWTAASVFGQNDLFSAAMHAYAQALELATRRTETPQEVVDHVALKGASKALDLSDSGFQTQHNAEQAANFLTWRSAEAKMSEKGLDLDIRLAILGHAYGEAASALRTATSRGVHLASVSSARRVAVVLLAQLPSPDDWRSRFGPFARPIYGECAAVSRGQAAEWLGEEHRSEAAATALTLGSQAVLFGQICICEETPDQSILLLHETVHDSVAAGMVRRVEDEWLPMTRDVPTAALETYLAYLSRFPPGPERAALIPYAELGRKAARSAADSIHDWVENMLWYCYQCRDETAASYECAAILAGVILELVDDMKMAEGYASHLSMASHEQALDRARRRVEVLL